MDRDMVNWTDIVIATIHNIKEEEEEAGGAHVIHATRRGSYQSRKIGQV